MITYQAYLVKEVDGSYLGSIEAIEKPEIQDGHIIVDVQFSSLNYKDALSASGPKTGVTRNYPFVPGIDAVGSVTELSLIHISEPTRPY